MTVTKRLTQKVGPAPLWAWLAVALAGTYLVYRHYRSGSSSATLNATPVAATSDVSGFGTGATGSGSSSSPADSSSGDLLSALDASTGSFDALLSALQAAGGGAGVTGGTGGTSGSSSAAASSVDQTATPSDVGTATTDVAAQNGVDYSNPYTVANAVQAGVLPSSALDQYVDPNTAAGRYAQSVAQQQADITGGAVAGPTPTTVTPAPTAAPVTYQSGTIVPKGTAQVA